MTKGTDMEDEQNKDDNARPHCEHRLAVRNKRQRQFTSEPPECPDLESMSMEELDRLPLPPELADKPLSYFEAMARKAAEEVVSQLPKGAPISPLVRSALNAGRHTPDHERPNGDQIGKSQAEPDIAVAVISFDPQ